MAFADPQSITIGADTSSLPRISNVENGGSFSKDDSTVKMSVKHAYGKRVRRVVRVDHQKTEPDPLVPAVNKPYSASVWMVVDVPAYGYTVAELHEVVNGFITQLKASSDTNIVKFLGGES